MTLVRPDIGGMPAPLGPPLLALEAAPGTPLPDETLAALAYACAYQSVRRHADGHVRAMDMPVGAVVYHEPTGKLYGAYARDQEMGGDDTSFHAEQLARGYAMRDGIDPSELSVAVTLEPCLSCLGELATAGSFVYLTPRSVIEDLGLVHRRVSAPDAAAQLPSCCRLTHLDHPELSVASAALFGFIDRDAETRRVTFAPGSGERPLPIDISRYVPGDLRRPLPDKR